MFLLHPPRIALRPQYCFNPDVFSAEECDRLIALFGEGEKATVDKGTADEKRRSRVTWLAWRADLDWVFQKLGTSVQDINGRFYGFHLSGYTEPLQLTRYEAAEAGHYDWHQDIGSDGLSIRKLSQVVLLSEETAFEGGSLEIQGVGKPAEMKRGAIITFPSWEQHRVTEVTKGTRFSLVSWISGPPYV